MLLVSRIAHYSRGLMVTFTLRCRAKVQIFQWEKQDGHKWWDSDLTPPNFVFNRLRHTWVCAHAVHQVKQFFFPGVSVEQGCVLVLAPSCRGKEPCCSHLIRARLSVPPIRLLWISFKFPDGTRVLVHVFEVTSHCWAEQDNISVFCCAGAQLCQPLSHPSPSSPAFLTFHSLLIHLLIMTIIRNFILLCMVLPHYCCPGFFLPFQKHGIWRPCKDFSLSCLASMASWSLLLHPDPARAALDAVTCLVSPPAHCLHHPDFIPATHFSFEEHVCCSHISAALLLSLPAFLL